MLKDITIGQYYPVNSVLHRLDPRVKLIGTVIFLISLFFKNTCYSFLLAGGFLAIIVILSKIPFRYIVKGMKSIVIIMLFTVVFNLFLTPGETVFRWTIFKITKEGIYSASYMLIRLIMLIIGSSLMTFTTTPNQLTDGMEYVFAPLKLFHLPVHEVAMMMSIALRFIPILMEETDKIMKAQQARGADFETGGLVKRAKAMIPILVPLFVSAFRRAGDLVMAMEARCYRGGKGRTKMKPLRYKRRDYIAWLILMIYFSMMIILRIIR